MNLDWVEIAVALIGALNLYMHTSIKAEIKSVELRLTKSMYAILTGKEMKE